MLFLLLGLLGIRLRGIDSWQSKAERESAVTYLFQRPTFLLLGCSITKCYFVFSKMPECVSYVYVVCNLKTRWGWPARSRELSFPNEEGRGEGHRSPSSPKARSCLPGIGMYIWACWINEQTGTEMLTRFAWWQFGMGGQCACRQWCHFCVHRWP